jgi:hypothetical protein
MPRLFAGVCHIQSRVAGLCHVQSQVAGVCSLGSLQRPVQVARVCYVQRQALPYQERKDTHKMEMAKALE